MPLKLKTSSVPVERELDDLRAAQFVAAHSDIGHLLALEQLFAYLTENLYELERETARISLFAAINIAINPHDETHELMRRLCNFLSSCRMYLDQAPQHLGGISLPNPFDGDEFKRSCSAQYHASPAYQAMYKLRNVAQHEDFPAESLNRSGHRVRRGNAVHAVHVT